MLGIQPYFEKNKKFRKKKFLFKKKLEIYNFLKIHFIWIVIYMLFFYKFKKNVIFFKSFFLWTLSLDCWTLSFLVNKIVLNANIKWHISKRVFLNLTEQKSRKIQKNTKEIFFLIPKYILFEKLVFRLFIVIPDQIVIFFSVFYDLFRWSYHSFSPRDQNLRAFETLWKRYIIIF